jgi:hypothetical protein
MLKVHVAERLAIAAGLVPPDRPVRQFLSLGVTATVLAAVVAVVTLYVGVRELSQPGVIYDRDAASVESVYQVAPAAGPSKLMSVEDISRLADD